MSLPNILLVVWDACRLDAARDHAPTLASLAAENLWFENAVTPGGYSLPSHVSMVTGRYPHEHGIYSLIHSIDETPLVEELGERGYARYGVSANGFASPNYEFDREFDRFYNTQSEMVYPKGIDVHHYARKARTRDSGKFAIGGINPLHLSREVLTHPHPLKSTANFAAAGIRDAVNTWPVLRRVPHPRFDKYSEFCYSPAKNTRAIRSVFDEAAEGDQPFFVFANYMDAHHPYAPPAHYQREYLGRTLPYRRLSELAEQTSPWEFIRAVQRGERPLDDATLETVRDLYAGEVRTADEHLRKLLDALDERGLREETLVVVTADHGENLGETDRMGETRIGHVLSSSDNLLRVPLVVAHPRLEGRRVEEYVSTKDLRWLLTDGLRDFVESEGSDLSALWPENGIVSGQVPAKLKQALYDRYPELSDLFQRHIAVCYANDWKVVLTSADEEGAWHGEEPRPLQEVPTELVSTCRNNLEALIETTHEGTNEVDTGHLEALGYL